MTHHPVWFTVPAPRATAPERAAQYAEFEKNWLAELAPEGAMELEVCHDFIRSAWRKREVIEAQNELDAGFLSDDNSVTRKFDRLMRYEREFESRCNKAIAILRKLQAQRHRPEPKPPAPQLAGLPDKVVQTLHIMDIESRHFNSRVRARKSGVTDGDTILSKLPIAA